MDVEDSVFPLGSLTWDEESVTLPPPLHQALWESSQKMGKDREKQRHRWKEECRVFSAQIPEFPRPASPWARRQKLFWPMLVSVGFWSLTNKRPSRCREI